MPGFKRYKKVFLSALIAVLVIAAGWWFYAKNMQPQGDARFAYSCAGGTESMSCLQQQYQTLAKTKGVTAAFTQLKIAYQRDNSVRAYCHQITHAIGRQAAETAKDVASAYSEGDSFCWSGYYHGVMEAIIRKIGVAHVAAQVPVICQPLKQAQPYSFYHYNCVHGVGHGIMDVKQGDLFASLTLCDAFTDQWERESCYGGVFMQNVMDELDDDHGKPDFKDDDPMYPCTAVKDQYKEQCYLMQTSHALKVGNEDFAKVFQECSTIEPAYKDMCYQSLGRDASGNSASDVVQTRTSCLLGGDAEAQSNCIIGAVKDFVSYYHSDQQANELCRSLEPSLASVCQTTKQHYYATF